MKGDRYEEIFQNQRFCAFQTIAIPTNRPTDQQIWPLLEVRGNSAMLESTSLELLKFRTIHPRIKTEKSLLELSRCVNATPETTWQKKLFYKDFERNFDIVRIITKLDNDDRSLRWWRWLKVMTVVEGDDGSWRWWR